MARSFLSADWYRVADMRPRLRSHVEIHRQVYRGGVWHVVQDHQNGRFHRISPAGNLILNLMDGRRTVGQLWEIACERFPDDPPTQDEVIRLLAQLHRSDLVAGEADVLAWSAVHSRHTLGIDGVNMQITPDQLTPLVGSRQRRREYQKCVSKHGLSLRPGLRRVQSNVVHSIVCDCVQR